MATKIKIDEEEIETIDIYEAYKVTDNISSIRYKVNGVFTTKDFNISIKELMRLVNKQEDKKWLHNDKHYFDLGKSHGRNKFNWCHFIVGIMLGIAICNAIFEISK